MSIHRAASQVPVRAAFLIAEGTTNVFSTTNATGAVITTDLTAASPSTYSAGTMFRDMGKTVALVDSITGMVSKRYRLAQPVSGASTEGVGPNAVYVQVYAASGSGVTVSRTA